VAARDSRQIARGSLAPQESDLAAEAPMPPHAHTAGNGGTAGKDQEQETMTMNRIALILTASTLTFLAAAISPAKAEDPEPGGPATIQIDRLEGLYGPVTFDHAKHATRYAEGCGDCHHQHSAYDENPCKRCHAIDAAQFKASVKRNFTACSKCHGDYDVEAPEVPDLKVAYHEVCFSCHRKIGDVGTTPASCEQLCHVKKE
jgi:hypothetical protein